MRACCLHPQRWCCLTSTAADGTATKSASVVRSHCSAPLQLVDWMTGGCIPSSRDMSYIIITCPLALPTFTGSALAHTMEASPHHHQVDPSVRLPLPPKVYCVRQLHYEPHTLRIRFAADCLPGHRKESALKLHGLRCTRRKDLLGLLPTPTPTRFSAHTNTIAYAFVDGRTTSP